MGPIVDDSDLIGKWGIVHWSPEHNLHHGNHVIHHEDFVKWNTDHEYGGYFKCEKVDGIFLVITDGNSEYRIKSQLFQQASTPYKWVGDLVIVESGGILVQCQIAKVIWHYKRNEPFYLLCKNGKLSSKQYWKNDFK